MEQKVGPIFTTRDLLTGPLLHCTCFILPLSRSNLWPQVVFPHLGAAHGKAQDGIKIRLTAQLSSAINMPWTCHTSSVSCAPLAATFQPFPTQKQHLAADLSGSPCSPNRAESVEPAEKALVASPVLTPQVAPVACHRSLDPGLCRPREDDTWKKLVICLKTCLTTADSCLKTLDFTGPNFQPSTETLT